MELYDFSPVVTARLARMELIRRGRPSNSLDLKRLVSWAQKLDTTINPIVVTGYQLMEGIKKEELKQALEKNDYRDVEVQAFTKFQLPLNELFVDRVSDGRRLASIIFIYETDKIL